MNGRRHGRKPTIALWMLVAVADLALLVTATSLLTMALVLAGLVTIAAGVVAVRPLLRRPADPAEVVARRRA
jgi:hypothetical protein